MAARQLAFDLPLRAAHGRGDFLVAPCNAAAVAWIDRWPDWPGPGLALVGPPGSGRRHLAAVWRARAAAETVEARDLPALRATPKACVVEGCEAAVNDPPVAEALFHLYNRIAAARGHVLLLGETPPARWPAALPDLRSRLATLPTAEIKPPDDALLAGLFVKLFGDRQIKVAGDTVLYLVARIERSYAAVLAAVEALDRAALAERRPITQPLVRAVLNLG